MSLAFSVVSMHRSLQKDNIQHLLGFQVFQSIYNCTLYLKYSSVVIGTSLYDDRDLRSIVWYMSLISSFTAGACQLVFYLIWPALYKRHEYKIFKRIGILYQNLRGYRLYRYSKVLLLTYTQLASLSLLCCLTYSQSNYLLAMDALLLLLLLRQTFRSIKAVIDEDSLVLQIHQGVMLLSQVYLSLRCYMFYQQYSKGEQSIFFSTWCLNLVISKLPM